MKTGRYSLKEILTHNEIEQIIIPEIQRDYVWGPENVVKLLDSITKGLSKKETHTFQIRINDKLEDNETISTFLKQEFERLKYHLKIGFIYAYHDRDYAGKFFLIDGQQRLTTMFLILLFLYKETGNQKDFRALYFKNGLLKLDYKVREQSHDFMLLLVDSVLNNQDFESSQKYYTSDYQHDLTIQNLISNYRLISKKLQNLEKSQKSDFLDYVENFIELNYFDTHLSEQGEQLYIYMNSRGEQLSHQEIIRAELMQKVSKDEKKHFGKVWENWQNYFWVNRGENKNADKGFEEFLKWATIFHFSLVENPVLDDFIGGEKSLTLKERKESYIREYNGNTQNDRELRKAQKEAFFKYQSTYLDFNFLEQVFGSLETLYSMPKQYIPIEEAWLSNKPKVIDYVILLPLIVYIKQNTWNTKAEQFSDVQRLAMFLKNITYFEGVSKNPDTGVLDTIEITQNLIGDRKDLINLLSFSSSKNFLTEAEKAKLEKYQMAGLERNKLEEFIWDTTLESNFSAFLMGNISILFKCSEDESIVSFSEEWFENLRDYRSLTKEFIFENRQSDKLRRLMLCYFNFLNSAGTGNGLQKRSFIGTENNWEVYREWEQLFNKSETVLMLKDIKALNPNNLDLLLETKKLNYSEKNWKEAFIRDFNLLKYCKNKKILIQDEHRILLLEKTNYSVHGSKEIQCKLLESRFTKEEMCIYENNCCVIDFVFNDQLEVFEMQESEIDFALDIIYKQDNKRWIFNLFHRKTNILDLFKPTSESIWRIQGDRITIQDGFLYKYDITKSLLENTDEIEKIVRDVVKTQIMPLLLQLNNEIVKETLFE